jgi:hypothetical protein
MHIDLIMAKEHLTRNNLTLTVVRNGEVLLELTDRGIRGLFNAFFAPGEPLRDSFVADKIVGKGAAFLMAASGIAGLYTNVISRGAVEVLEAHNVQFEYQKLCDNILNRNKTGLCPVEQLCIHIIKPEEAISAISGFLKGGKNL